MDIQPTEEQLNKKISPLWGWFFVLISSLSAVLAFTKYYYIVPYISFGGLFTIILGLGYSFSKNKQKEKVFYILFIIFIVLLFIAKIFFL